jgi:hypothetical protein
MLTRTSSITCPFAPFLLQFSTLGDVSQSSELQLFALSYIKPNFKVYPPASAMLPLRQVITLSAMVNASGPLTLITEIAPVPGTVAGAHIVSSFRIYISRVLIVAKLSQIIYLRKVLRVSVRVVNKSTN